MKAAKVHLSGGVRRCPPPLARRHCERKVFLHDRFNGLTFSANVVIIEGKIGLMIAPYQSIEMVDHYYCQNCVSCGGYVVKSFYLACWAIHHGEGVSFGTFPLHSLTVAIT